jgi:hypothetical protein
MLPLPSHMPQRHLPIESLAFELEWSFAGEADERVMLSSVDRYRRLVLGAGGSVQRCDVDTGSRSGGPPTARMSVRCDRPAIAKVPSPMLADEAIAWHLVRRLDTTAAPARAADFGAMSLAAPAVEALNALIQRRVAEHIRAQPGLDGPMSASMRMLGAREVGVRLGNLSDQTVRIREKERKLFSLLRPNRQRGREYPEYQLEQGVHGRPLNAVLRTLCDASGEQVHAFFTTPLARLGDLTPLEMLKGAAFSGGGVDQLLVQAPEQRLAAVLEAAREFLLDSA